MGLRVVGKAYFLTPEDVGIIRRLVAFERRFTHGRNHPEEEGRPDLSSRVYIAKPKNGGIPALTPSEGEGTSSGTSATGSEYDEPGKARCDIYRIVDSQMFSSSGTSSGSETGTIFPGSGTGTSDDVPILYTPAPQLRPVEFDALVYNLSEEIVDQKWILVVKDRFNFWVAVTGGVGGGTARAILEGDLYRGTLFSWTSAPATILNPNDAGTGWEEGAPLGIQVYDDGIGGGGTNPILSGVLIDIARIKGRWFYDGGGGCAVPQDTGTGTSSGSA